MTTEGTHTLEELINLSNRYIAILLDCIHGSHSIQEIGSKFIKMVFNEKDLPYLLIVTKNDKEFCAASKVSTNKYNTLMLSYNNKKEIWLRIRDSSEGVGLGKLKYEFRETTLVASVVDFKTI
jgi:GTP-binding protein EngB required for normal cell division